MLAFNFLMLIYQQSYIVISFHVFIIINSIGKTLYRQQYLYPEESNLITFIHRSGSQQI